MKKQAEIVLIAGSALEMVKSLWEKRLEMTIGGYSGAKSETHDICILRHTESIFTLTLTGFTDKEQKELRRETIDAS